MGFSFVCTLLLYSSSSDFELHALPTTMKCKVCQVDKLSREFPSDSITHTCDHPPLYCLRCVTEAQNAGKCPYPGCQQMVPKDSERLKECKELLEFMFPPIEPPAADLQTEVNTTDKSQQAVHVTTLTGDTQSFKFLEKMPVAELKSQIHVSMKVQPSHQRLVYKEKELQSYQSNGKDYTLDDFGIKPFATIHMMVLLCAVPENFDHVVFDLSWNYPASGRDFLDAHCMLFMKDVWYNWVDWRAPGNPNEICHSGDEMNDTKRVGHHRIEAKLKNIPKCVSHLFFFLSSLRSPTISKFPNPTLQFYDAADTNRVLDHFEVSYTNELNCQALIVCCVSRTRDDKWLIYKGGQPMAGNVGDYWTLEAKVKEIINRNTFPGESLAEGKTLITLMNAEQQRLYNLRLKNR